MEYRDMLLERILEVLKEINDIVGKILIWMVLLLGVIAVKLIFF